MQCSFGEYFTGFGELLDVSPEMSGIKLVVVVSSNSVHLRE